MLPVPAWVLAIAPLAALVCVGLWTVAPRRRRDPALRSVLIVSVGIAAIEAVVAMLLVGFLVLFSVSGGMENF